MPQGGQRLALGEDSATSVAAGGRHGGALDVSADIKKENLAFFNFSADIKEKNLAYLVI